jgi:hypothetical protein
MVIIRPGYIDLHQRRNRPSHGPSIGERLAAAKSVSPATSDPSPMLTQRSMRRMVTIRSFKDVRAWR